MDASGKLIAVIRRRGGALALFLFATCASGQLEAATIRGRITECAGGVGLAGYVVRAFEAAATKAGKSVDFKIYDGAGHAFANVDNPWGGYRKEAAEDAWARSTAFLAKHLKK